MDPASTRLKVLQITSMYPSSSHPALGTFVKSQIDSLRPFVDIELIIVRGLNGIGPYILAIPKLLQALYFNPYDIIHIHYGNIASLVKLIYLGRRPIVTSYCGDDLLGTIVSEGKYTVKSKFFMKLNRYLAGRDSCSIVKSKMMESKIERAKKIELIPNGVDIDIFKPIDRDEARQRIPQLRLNKKVILFPANPEIPVKNFQLLRGVLEQIGQTDIELLTFAGNKVTRDLVPFYFNAADIVVFTSLSEGSPNVIKEAMACNCKVYSTPCGDVAWLLENVSGSKVLPFNASVWKHALVEALKDGESEPSNSREMLIKKKLDTISVAEKIVHIYQTVYRGHKI